MCPAVWCLGGCLCLWAARVRACLVHLRCYALGQSLRASRCLRRLPLPVIGCDALAKHRLFYKESMALGCEPWACAATSTFRCHPSTGAGPCVPVAHGWPKLLAVCKTLAPSQKLEPKLSARKVWHCLTGVASSLHRSLTQPANQRATGHGCQSASGEFSFCLKKGPLARAAPSPSAHPHRGYATASGKPRKRAKKAPPRQRDASRARAERRRRRQKAVPAATARRQEAPQARRRPTETREAGGSFRRAPARTGPAEPRAAESQPREK